MDDKEPSFLQDNQSDLNLTLLLLYVPSASGTRNVKKQEGQI